MTYPYHSNFVEEFNVLGIGFIFLDYQDIKFNQSIHIQFKMGNCNNGYIQLSYMPPPPNSTWPRRCMNLLTSAPLTLSNSIFLRQNGQLMKVCLYSHLKKN